MRTTKLAMLLCVLLMFSAVMVLPVRADVGMRIINGQATQTQAVTTYSFIAKDGWFTATVSIERPEFERVEFHTWVGTVSTYTVEAIQSPANTVLGIYTLTVQQEPD